METQSAGREVADLRQEAERPHYVLDIHKGSIDLAEIFARRAKRQQEEQTDGEVRT